MGEWVQKEHWEPSGDNIAMYELDLVTTFELVVTSSLVRLLLLVIQGALRCVLCEGECRCLIRKSIDSGD